MNQPILNIVGLKKQYGGNTVLDIDGMDVEQGRITTIIGPSGAGKSTLLSIVNGIEPPTEGRIVFDKSTFSTGKNYSLEARRHMVMVFQKPAVFNASVYENIAYGLKLRNTPVTTIRQRVEEMLELIGLKDKHHQRAHTLSGGEAQRVTLARAMVLQPKLLLLDEPTANLDPANVIHMESLIRYARDHYKSTVLMVTHNMFQAKRLADSVIFMLNGMVVEYGSAEKMFDHPENEMTLAFIEGKMIY